VGDCPKSIIWGGRASLPAKGESNVLLKAVATALALWLLFLSFALFVILQTEVLVIDIYKKPQQKHIYLPIPILLLRVALSLSPPGQKEKIRSNLAINPNSLKILSEKLAECPDTSFFRMEKPGQNIFIRKHGRNLHIDAESRSENVHIRIPLIAASKAFAMLTESPTEKW